MLVDVCCLLFGGCFSVCLRDGRCLFVVVCWLLRGDLSYSLFCLFVVVC